MTPSTGTLTAALLIGLAGSATAATVTYNSTPNPITVSSAGPTLFTLENFDTTLGTVTAIQIVLTNTLTGNGQVFNLGAPTAYTLLTGAVQLTLTNNSDGATTNTTVHTPDQSGTASTGLNYASPTTTGPTNLTLNPVDLVEYEGVGPSTDSYTFGVGTTAWGVSGINLFAGGTNTESATAEVTYTFTAAVTTPEPATAALLSGALIGLILRRRKHKPSLPDSPSKNDL